MIAAVLPFAAPVTLLAVALPLAAAPTAFAEAPTALARPYAPPGRHVFAGLTGGTSITAFARMTGKHPPVFETYMTWDTPTGWLRGAHRGFRCRLAIHISTSTGYGRAGVITPLAIAHGGSDRFLIRLGRDLAASHRIVYIRLMGEMNGYWNAYSAFTADGRLRSAANTPAAWIAAWRRTVLILRGGPLRRLDARLRRLGLPRLRARMRPTAMLARPRVAFLWVPQDAGSPDIAANAPGGFWPGAAYVDWVGTDFYASFPDFARLSAFYARFGGKPFVLSEWALYGGDNPGFVRALFAWVRAHPRVRMLNYYQGFSAAGPANLAHYPASRRALRRALRSPRFLAYAPEFAHPRGRGRPESGPPHSPVPSQPPTPPVPAPPPPGRPPGLCVLGICVVL